MSFFESKEKQVSRILEKKGLEPLRLVTVQIYPLSSNTLGTTTFKCECGFTVQSPSYTVGETVKCDRCLRAYTVSLAFIAEQITP